MSAWILGLPWSDIASGVDVVFAAVAAVAAYLSVRVTRKQFEEQRDGEKVAAASAYYGLIVRDSAIRGIRELREDIMDRLNAWDDELETLQEAPVGEVMAMSRAILAGMTRAITRARDDTLLGAQVWGDATLLERLQVAYESLEDATVNATACIGLRREWEAGSVMNAAGQVIAALRDGDPGAGAQRLPRLKS